ncbi:hypothetical protein [Rugamonas sp. DEMB1]|uniref:hypothetical protein n=1 Tax=Rugamonas sp. DEMB1 TaxID=3039386 RepID=UPI00244C6033|nr:hypothetical protein [Rugamonas sp. DEMB1]WGG48970.1 hypothetical protein QC826_20305 [Rugamonas sp. DEMB1]
MTEFFTPGDGAWRGISPHHSKFADGNFYSRPPRPAPGSTAPPQVLVFPNENLLGKLIAENRAGPDARDSSSKYLS